MKPNLWIQSYFGFGLYVAYVTITHNQEAYLLVLMVLKD